ncbi:putative ribonuclease H-like domain-containing protein [Tanacetum coccineum]
MARSKEANAYNPYSDHIFDSSINAVSSSFDVPDDPNMPALEDIGIFDDAYDDRDEVVEADLNNLELTTVVSPIPTSRIDKDHPKDQIIGELHSATQTREPKKVTQAMEDPSWIGAMQEELTQFSLQKVWTLVDLPNVKRAIGTKWVYRNKKDKRGIIVRNKVRLVAQRHTQQEGIDFDEFPNKVYKVEKALYGLHQAPRAWYETLSTYLLENGFRRGIIDKTLLIKKDKSDIMLVQKFDFTKVKTTSTPLEPNKPLLKDEEATDVDVHLYRSMIGSLMYLTASRPNIMFAVCNCARFQVSPKTSHLHAVKRIFRYLKGQPKLGLWKSTTGGCQFLGRRLISWQCKKQTIVANSTTEAEYVAAGNCCGQFVDQHNMVACLERNDGNAEFHQIVDFLSSSTIHYALTVSPTIYAYYIEQFWATAKSQTVNNVKQIHAIVDGKAVVISKSLVRNDLLFDNEDGITCLTNDDIFENLTLMGTVSPLFDSMLVQNQAPEGEGSAIPPEPQPTTFALQPNVSQPQTEPLQTETSQIISHAPQTEAHIEQILPSLSTYQRQQPKDPNTYRRTKRGEDDRVVRTATTASSLKAEQESGNITKTQPTATLNEPSPQGTSSGGHTLGSGEDNMEHQFELMDNVPHSPHDSPLPGVNTPGSDEGSLELKELMDLITKLSQRVLALEQSKTAQDLVINKLQKKVKRLQKALRASTPGMKLFKIDSDFEELGNIMENVEGGSVAERITTARDTLNTASINVSTARPLKVSAAGPSTSTAGDIFEDEMTTIVDTLVAIRSARPRTTSVVIHNIEEELRRATPVPTVQTQDKGKGKMVEPEPTPKNPRKAQIKLDEELAQRLFAEEQEQFEREERIAKERAAEQEAKNAELIEQMEDKLCKKEQQRIDDFVPMDSELEVQRLKRSGHEVSEEPCKRQKIEETSSSDAEQSAKKVLSEEELQNLLVVVPVEEVYVEALQVKYPIIGWEVYSEDTRRYWRIIRIWDLVKERFNATKPTDDKEDELWVELKRLFEPDSDETLWKLQRYMHDPLIWKLYDTCGVHHVSSSRGHDIFMLVETDYPLTRGLMAVMLVNKLQVDEPSEMANELLRKIFILANRPRQPLQLSTAGVNLLLLVEVDTATKD